MAPDVILMAIVFALSMVVPSHHYLFTIIFGKHIHFKVLNTLVFQLKFFG